MPKRTKTQKRRALKAIQDKAWVLCNDNLMSINDFAAIKKITAKGLNKLRGV